MSPRLNPPGLFLFKGEVRAQTTRGVLLRNSAVYLLKGAPRPLESLAVYIIGHRRAGLELSLRKCRLSWGSCRSILVLTMEGLWDLDRTREIKKRPFYGVAALLSLCAIAIFFAEGLFKIPFGHTPLILMGCVVWLLTFIEVKIGFGIAILCIALSPEFVIYGVPNLRLEDFVFPAVFTAWLTRALGERWPLTPTNLKVPLLLLIVISIASSLRSLVYSDFPFWTSFFRLGKGIEYYLMFFVALNLPKNRSEIGAFAHLLWIAAALAAVYGAGQLLLQGPGIRVSGPPGETANILGGFLTFHACLLLGIASNKQSLKPVALGIVLLMLVPFVYTFSRTTYVAFFAGIVLLTLLTKDRSLLVVLAFGAVLIVVTQARDRFETLLGLLSGNPPSSWTARVEGWKAFFPAILQAPLLGKGVGAAPLLIDNEYVRRVYEVGFLGLLLFFVIVWRSARTAFGLSKNSPHSLFRGFALGYLAGTASLLVHSLAATSFTTIRTAEPFFIATGLLYAAAAYDKGLLRGAESSEGFPETPLSEPLFELPGSKSKG